jgi:hypothetical protein
MESRIWGPQTRYMLALGVGVQGSFLVSMPCHSHGESHITFDWPRQVTSSVYVKYFPSGQGYRKVINRFRQFKKNSMI